MCAALARALSCGKRRPAKGPDVSTVPCSTGVSGRLDQSEASSVGDVVPHAEWKRAPFQLCRRVPCSSVDVCEVLGKSASRIRQMEAKCEPASTARMEFLDHFVAQDRTRKPVTLSSLGPPPAACLESQARNSHLQIALVRTKHISCSAGSASLDCRRCSRELFMGPQRISETTESKLVRTLDPFWMPS